MQWIDYSDVNSVGDKFGLLFAGRRLGSSNGPGFGWRDTTTVKIGVNYVISDQWQVRAGYSYTAQPIAADNTFINILAPGTISNQIAGGFTWTNRHVEITSAISYAFPDTVKGVNSIPSGFGGGNANIKLSEVFGALEFGYRF